MKSQTNQPVIQVTGLPDGRSKIGLKFGWEILSAQVSTNPAEMEKAGALHPRATPPRRKIAAARWHLAQLRRCIFNEGAALMFLDSFLSELRASTFVLQKLLKHTPGFNEWYEEECTQLRLDPELRWLVDARNSSQKEGLTTATYGPHVVARFHRNGGADAVLQEPILTINELNRQVTLSQLERMVTRLDTLIETAHSQFYSHPPPRQHQIKMEFRREREDGQWENFALPNPPAVTAHRSPS